MLAHALMDALIGALREGDVGRLFPDTDPQYEGADSLVLLSRVAQSRAREQGFELEDADCVLVLEEPKIAPHREAMRDEPRPGDGRRGRTQLA